MSREPGLALGTIKSLPPPPRPAPPPNSSYPYYHFSCTVHILKIILKRFEYTILYPMTFSLTSSSPISLGSVPHPPPPPIKKRPLVMPVSDKNT